jgi:hypothetical protein
MNDLLNAVCVFVEVKLKDRRYCPECMGCLPKHEGDCNLGKLIAVYEKVKL